MQFRKSKKAGPFRVTASKSGLSVSGGVGPVRASRGADGKTRRTVRAPGTGIYDTKVVGGKKKSGGGSEQAKVPTRDGQGSSMREPARLPTLDGYGAVVEFDGEVLHITPTGRLSATGLGGKKGQAIVLTLEDVADVGYQEARLATNGRVTVHETGGATRTIYFTRQQAKQPWRELAEMLTTWAAQPE